MFILSHLAPISDNLQPKLLLLGRRARRQLGVRSLVDGAPKQVGLAEGFSIDATDVDIAQHAKLLELHLLGAKGKRAAT